MHFHNGVDLEAHYEPVMAVASGKVIKVGHDERAGLFIVLDHGKGIQTSYAHLSQALVTTYQNISGGQKIAISGNTGISTAPHLHFKIELEKKCINPELLVK